MHKVCYDLGALGDPGTGMEKIGVVFLSAGVSLFSRSWIKTKIPVPRICKKGSTLPEEPLGERSQKIAKGSILPCTRLVLFRCL
jgi:hypothetical protein